MSLPIGTRLGPYEIVAPIGAGGMGEVYRARDTRLDRDVAIKVLPAGRVGDADAEARFEREARAVAGLNHPNICALYDVGLDGSSHHFLVMELLEGQTFQERLTNGPFELPELLRLVIALVDALETAHARGVLHRDLKPANVFLTSRGTPKLLDFGLAKGLDASSDMTRAADGLTSAGMAVGTMGYMSPEQLRGESIDARSDLFSMGVVLYEMATGRRAFSGGTGPAVAAGILTARPEAPRSMRSDLPPKLDEIILKLLEKDRDLRFQSAAELGTTLKQVVPGEATLRHADGASSAAVPAGPAKRRSRAVTLAIVAGGGILVAGGIWMASQSRSPSTAAASRALTIEALTFTGNARDGALSPDGRFVAYVHLDGAEASVWVRQLATQSDVQIVPPVAGRRFVGLSVTPDGNYVDFVVSGPRDLWRVAFLGGTPRLIASDVWSATGWSGDGKHFAFIRADGNGTSDAVMVADTDGTHQRVLASRVAPERFLSDSRTDRPIARPSWSADDKTLLVLGFSAAGPAQVQELITLDAVTGAARQTLPLPGASALEAAWVDATHALINHQEGAREPQLSLCDLRTGSMSPITQNFTPFRGVSLTGDRLAAVSTRLDQRSSIWIGGALGGAMVEAVPESPAIRGSVFVDNQGGLIYEMATAAGSGIYARATDTSQPRLVVNNASPAAMTSDGRIVVFRRDGAIMRVNTDGSSLAGLADGIGAAQAVLTRDNQTVVFVSATRGLQSLWAAPLAGGPAREIAHRFASRPDLSFDGRHLLFLSNNAASQRVTVVCDLPDCTNQREVPNIAGAWTPDGRSVAYIDSTDPKNIYVQPVGGGASRRLTSFTEKNILDFQWSADGKRLAITRGTTLADMVLIRGFR